MSQEIYGSLAGKMIYVGTKSKPASLTVYDKVFIPKLNPNNPNPNDKGQIVYADIDGELKTSPGLSSNAPSFLFDPVNGFNLRQVNSQFGAVGQTGPTGPPFNPVSQTRISNKLILQGPIYDATRPASQGGIGPQLGQAGQVLISDSEGRVTWGENGSVVGTGTVLKLPLWTPNGTELGDSLLIQDGASSATQVTNAGKWINTGTMTLLTAAQDAVAEKVLVLDGVGLVKFRYANSIGVQGTGTIARVPLWSPDGENIESSLLIQSGIVQPPVNWPSSKPSFIEQMLTNNGNFTNDGTMKVKGT